MFVLKLRGGPRKPSKGQLAGALQRRSLHDRRRVAPITLPAISIMAEPDKDEATDAVETPKT